MLRFTLALALAGSLVAAEKPTVRRGLADLQCVTRSIEFGDFNAGDTPTNLGYGVTVEGSSTIGGFPAMIFDTANPTGGDFDLASDVLGKVLIVSEDGDSSDPDDAADGGTIVFTFEHPVEVLDALVLDDGKGTITGVKPDGKTVQKKIPVGVDNELKTIPFRKKEITELTFFFEISGAIVSIEYIDCSGRSDLVANDLTSGPAGLKSGGSGGDPHFKRWNGLRFGFHGECDLMLLHSDKFADGLGLDLHIRTTHLDMYSYIETAALRIGDSILEISPGQLIVDGGDITDDELPIDLSGFTINPPEEIENGRVYTVDLNNGDAISFRMYKFMLSVDIVGNTASDFSDSVGLLGHYETGNLLGRDGVTVIKDFDEFGMEWQVQAEEPKLFQDTDRSPQLPRATCLMPAMDHRRVLETFSAKQKAKAQEACASKSKNDFDFCVSDVLLTGDVGMAGAW